jgi:hypothetical protein
MKFKSVENGLAVGPGHPTLVYFCIDTEMAVEICAVPMIGLDIDDPNALSFSAQVHSNKALLTATVSTAIRNALSMFDMTHLLNAYTGEDDKHIIFRIAVDTQPNVQSDGTHHYSAVAHVTVEEYVITRAVELMRKQMEAHGRVAELHSTSYMQSAVKH